MRTTSTQLKRRPANRRRRGAQMLEFAMLLPLFLFMVLFAIDMGRLVMLNGALTDATYQGARAGAQVGGGGVGQNGVSVVAFNQAIEDMPGLETENISRLDVTTGQTCSATGRNRYVTVRSTYQVELITPGLTSLLALGSDRADDEGWTISATSVARCEVAR